MLYWLICYPLSPWRTLFEMRELSLLTSLSSVNLVTFGEKVSWFGYAVTVP